MTSYAGTPPRTVRTGPPSPTVRRRASRQRIWLSALWLSLPALVAVVALFIAPFIYGLNLSLHTGYHGNGAWSLHNYVQFFNDPYLRETIGKTFQVALPATFIDVLLSLPLAYFLRQGIRFERVITAILILPITFGPVLIAQGMLTYFTPNGWFQRSLLAIHILQAPVRILQTLPAVQLALVIQGFPFVFLMILGYMSAINPDLEKASRMLGANEWQTFWRVLFPLTLPGIAIAFSLNFVANFGVFPTANLVGAPQSATHVIAIEAYNQAYNNYNPPFGTAIALLMGAVQLIVIGAILWLQGRLARGAAIGGGKGA